MTAPQILKVMAGEGDHATALTVKGRDAWALAALIEAGDRGVTPITHPAPRWSAYVFKLRQAGLVIETIHENHGGDYPGHHARYVLRTPVRVTEGARHG